MATVDMAAIWFQGGTPMASMDRRSPKDTGYLSTLEMKIREEKKSSQVDNFL